MRGKHTKGPLSVKPSPKQRGKFFDVWSGMYWDAGDLMQAKS